METEKFGIESKNETMEVKARYFDPICCLFLLVKLKNTIFKTSDLPLAFQKKNCTKNCHLDLEKYPKGIPKNCVSFLRLGMNSNMKKNPLKNYISVKMFTTSILRAEKKNYKNYSYFFKYLKFTFQIVKK